MSTEAPAPPPGPGFGAESPDPVVLAREGAVRLLARREHSRLELAHKLALRGHEAGPVDTALAALEAEGLLSDARFAELYAQTRADKGYGPLKIRAELRGRGVADALVADALAGLDGTWDQNLTRLAGKKNGRGRRPDAGPAERARQQRFYRQRGFTLEQIDRLFRARA